MLFRAVLVGFYGKARRLPPIVCRLRLVARFQHECRERGVDFEQFEVFLDNRAGHVDRGFSLRPQARKIMKMVGQ